jgi:hypothetical protein
MASPLFRFSKNELFSGGRAEKAIFEKNTTSTYLAGFFEMLSALSRQEMSRFGHFLFL